MKKSFNIRDNDEGRRGVAILIVIAMLSTLMLTATAFSISMRLERKGSANYRHSVMARHMMWAALNMAIRDINNSLDGSGGFKVYPDWTVKASVNTSEDVKARVTTPDSKYHIPGEIRSKVMSAKPEWISVLNSDGAQVGRCAYVIANVSGFIDGSMAGGTNRAAGVTPKELQPTKGLNWESSAFKTRNEKHGRYESLQEMRRLNPDLYNALGGYNGGFAHVYSTSIEGEMLNNNNPNDIQPKINIGGTISELEAKSGEIMAAFEDCGFSLASDRMLLYLSLLDYLDKDCIPRSVSMPNCEAFPMANEVMFRYRLSGSRLMVIVQGEFVYPFANPRDDTFDYDTEFVLTYSVDGAAPVTITPHVTPPTGDATVLYTPGEKADPSPLFAANRNLATLLVNLPSAPTNKLEITDSKITINVKAGGAAVDLAEVEDRAVTLDSSAMDVSHYWETRDPRYNWLATHWRYAGDDATKATWNDIGTWTRLVIDMAKAGTRDYDDEFRWYVADSERLRNVGELGNLPISIDHSKGRLLTLKLYQHSLPGSHSEIFNQFSVTDPKQRRGLVNVNSTSSNVWASLVRGAPLGDPEDFSVDRYGDDNPNDPLSAGIDIANLVNSQHSSSGPFRDVSQFVELCNWKTIFPDLTDFEREMMISSCAGMLTARQNTFVVLLSGEKYVEFAMEAQGGKSMASVYAVATVSRDPFRDPDTGKHNVFIRSFNVLSQ